MATSVQITGLICGTLIIISLINYLKSLNEKGGKKDE